MDFLPFRGLNRPMRFVTATDLKDRPADIYEAAQTECVIVLKHGKPDVVMVGVRGQTKDSVRRGVLNREIRASRPRRLTPSQE